MWKRISAYLFDGIMLIILAIGCAVIFAQIFQLDMHSQAFNDYYTAYEEQHGVDFDLTVEEYEALSLEEQKQLNDLYLAMTQEPKAIELYNTMINLFLLILTLGILTSYMLLEFLVPLILKNGQTMGKRVFGICLMRTDRISISPMLLLIRTLLGKFTLETMIPLYIFLMIFFGSLGLLGTILLLSMGVLQIVLLKTSQTNSVIHDLLAKTVVVDMHSQMIFRTANDLQSYRTRHEVE